MEVVEDMTGEMVLTPGVVMEAMEVVEDMTGEMVLTPGVVMEAMEVVEDMTGEMVLTPGVVAVATAITQETIMTTMEAVVAVAMTGGTTMEEEVEDMAGTTMVDTMIMRTGSSSRGTMEEEEEEGFGMILHSIKAEVAAAAAGMEAMEVAATTVEEVEDIMVALEDIMGVVEGIMVAVRATVEVVEEADLQLDGGKVSRVEEVEVGLKIEEVLDIMGVKRPEMVAAVMAAAAVDVTRAVGVFVVLNIYKMVLNI